MLWSYEPYFRCEKNLKFGFHLVTRSILQFHRKVYLPKTAHFSKVRALDSLLGFKPRRTGLPNSRHASGLGCCLPRPVRRSIGIAMVPRHPSPLPASRRHPCRGVPARVPSNQSIRVAPRASRTPKPCPGVLECQMAGCRHGPEMGTHRADGRWTVPAGGCTRSVTSLGSP